MLFSRAGVIGGNGRHKHWGWQGGGLGDGGGEGLRGGLLFLTFSIASFPATPTANFGGRKNRKGREDKKRRGGNKIRAFRPAGRRNVYFFSLNSPNFSTQLKIIKCIKKAGMQFSRAQLLNNSSSAAPISLINPEV